MVRAWDEEFQTFSCTQTGMHNTPQAKCTKWAGITTGSMGDQATDQNLPSPHQIVPYRHEILCMEIENDDRV